MWFKAFWIMVLKSTSNTMKRIMSFRLFTMQLKTVTVINLNPNHQLWPHFNVTINHQNQGYADMIWILIEHGAEINATELVGRAPLHYASEYGNVES